MSGMSSLWSSFGIGSKDNSKSEKAKAALDADLKYLYSAFTKIPCLRLAPDHRARLIRGYEEFPLDTAVPLHAFKNLSALEIIDIDYRSFYGWDRLSEQLRTLTLKRAHLEDPADLLTKVVLDDIDKRRRRPSRSQASPVLGGSSSGSGPQPVYRHDSRVPSSAPGSPAPDSSLGSSTSPKAVPMIRGASEGEHGHRRAGSYSPTRPPMRQTRHSRAYSVNKLGRSGSGSSQNSSEVSLYGNRSSSNLLTGVLPATKWRFLRHLGLPDNSLISISTNSFTPVANTLHSLDLSSNLFTQVPESLASLVALRALNLSNCMIDSLRSIAKNPLPAITALNLRGNRLSSLAGIERLLSLERLDLRDNDLTDPTELARLTGLPEIREIWISGNPFTKTHSGHRVTIFNLFRSTPGYAEDIIIDASGPGYSERKQLVERAAEREAAPVVRPSEPELERTVSRVPAPAPSIKQAERTPQGRVEGSERRKKNSRRRIADVPGEQLIAANGGDSFQSNIITGTPFTDPFTDPFTEAGDKASKKPVAVASVEPVKKAVVPQKDKPLPVIPDLDWHSTGDAYRQKLEALRHDVGNSAWLGVLSDETWRQPTVSVPRAGTGFDTSMMRPTAMTRPGSQMIISGQTLG